MAVIESLMWLIQPKCAAISPMTAVSKPMKKMDVTKAGQPLHLSEQRARKKTKPLVLLGRLVISLGKIECPEKVIQKISSLSSSAFLGGVLNSGNRQISYQERRFRGRRKQ